MQEDILRICSVCKVPKTLDCFWTSKTGKYGKSSWCKICQTVVCRGSRRRASHTPKGRYSNAKSIAKRRRLPFTISLDIYSKLIVQPCYYCQNVLGAPVEAAVGLDRLDSGIGYEEGNVVSCCRVCNIMKSDSLTPEETLAAVAAVIAIRIQDKQVA